MRLIHIHAELRQTTELAETLVVVHGGAVPHIALILLVIIAVNGREE